MQEPTFYGGLPGAVPPVGQMQYRTTTQHMSSSLRRKLVLLLVPVLIIAIVAGGLTWLQWASQRGIELGYPVPQVHITPLSSNTALINDNIQFSADGIGRDITYSWDFGDGSTAYGPVVSHAYQQLSGDQNNYTYTVTVSVTDPLGRTSTDTTTIRVLPPAPTANFSYSEETDYTGAYDQYIDFDATSSAAGTDASIANYMWDFGDGYTDDNGSAQETHYYYSTGSYTVTLIVVDNIGQQSSPYQMTIQVQ
jgi:PKD repeat protein